MKIYNLEGLSMRNFIFETDKLIIEDIIQNIRNGDIVIYYTHDKLCAHRVLALFGNYAIVAGDNSRHFEFLHTKNILGRVRLILRGNTQYSMNKNIKLYILIVYLYLFIPVNNLCWSKIMSSDEQNILITKFKDILVAKRNKLQLNYLNTCILKGELS